MRLSRERSAQRRPARSLRARLRARRLVAPPTRRPDRRSVAPNLPFVLDERTLRNGLNFTLLTAIGGIDLLGEVAGGTYQDLVPHARRVRGFGCEFLAINLDKLIELKRFAGRAKDQEVIAELEALRQDKIAAAKQKRPDHF